MTTKLPSRLSFQSVGLLLCLLLCLLAAAVPHTVAANPVFQDVAPAKGLISTGTNYGGAWVPDINGDGRPDLWSANHSTSTAPVLYLSTPGGGFTTAPASYFQGLRSEDFHGSAWADVDNDGDRDLLVVAGAGRGLTSAANMLLINNGAGLLVESAAAFGIDYPFARSRDLLWLDWNNDGYLDVLLMNRNDRELPPDAKTQMFTYDVQTSSYVEENFAIDNFIEQLWGQLSFNNPSLGGQVPAFFTVARRGVAVVDRAFSYSAGGLVNVTNDLDMPVAGFANDSAMGDFNNDGTQDAVFVSNGGVSLFLQSASGFAAAPAPTGLNTDMAAFVLAEDFNNDGWLDIYVARSNPGQDINLPNVLFLNQADGTFLEVAQAGGAEGTDEGYVSGAASVDYDNDGRMDIYLPNSGDWWAPRALTVDAPMQLFENLDASGNHWLKIELRGTQSNADGIGASVWVTAGGLTQLREMNGGLHARSQNDSRLHFGMGSQTAAATIVVNWPSGAVQTLSNIAADQVLQIVEPGGGVNTPPQAEFTATGASQPLTVNFDGGGSFDPDGSVVTWSWNFGDGESGQGQSVAHSYPSAGIYTVELTVTDNGGATAATTQDVTVTSASGLTKLAITPLALGSNAFKKARLIDELGSGEQNLATFWNSNGSFTNSWVTFDLVTSEQVAEVLLAPRASTTTVFEITVGDNLAGNKVSGAAAHSCVVPATSSAQQPTELFVCTLPLVSGRYVTVSIPQARFQRIYGVEIHALADGPSNQPPIASFTRTPISGTADLQVDVDATGSFDLDGTVTTFAWSFGNGDVAGGELAQVTYTEAGEYIITLTVTDDGGATAQTTLPVSVAGPPIAPAISQQPQSITVQEGQTAMFSVTATGTAPLQYQWYRDSQMLAGETAASLDLTNAQPGDDGAGFSVDISNIAGMVSSAVAVLTVTESSGEPVKQPVTIAAVGANAFKSGRMIDELGSGEQRLTTNWGSDNVVANGWFTIDLGASSVVSELRIGMRPDRAYDLDVLVGETLVAGKVTGAAAQTCSTSAVGGFNPTSLTSCPLAPVTGRYVTIQAVAKFVRVHGLEIYVQP